MLKPIPGHAQVALTGANFLSVAGAGDTATLRLVGITAAQAAQDRANEAAAVAGTSITITAASQTYTFTNFTFNNQSSRSIK